MAAVQQPFWPPIALMNTAGTANATSSHCAGTSRRTANAKAPHPSNCQAAQASG